MAQTFVDRQHLSNLTFIIGDDFEDKRIPVIRDIVCLASPIFHAMLSNGFKQSALSEINFPDDDADTFELMLNIIHSEYHKVPEKVTFKQLFKLAVLVDEYDTLAFIRPTVDRLVESSEVLCPETPSEYGLYISWVFGYIHACRYFAKKSILDAKVGHGGETVGVVGSPLEVMPSPPGFADIVKTVRLRTIQQIMDRLSRFVTDELTIGSCKTWSVNCNLMRIGFLVSLQYKLGWSYEKPDSSVEKRSIRELCDIISQHAMKEIGYSVERPTHKECTIGAYLRKEIASILISTELPEGCLSDTYIDVQSRKGRARLGDNIGNRVAVYQQLKFEDPFSNLCHSTL